MYSEFGEVYQNENLEKFNTYGIKTTCDYLIKPNSLNNLILLLDIINKEKISYFIIGSGSNIIIPDTHFKGIIINLDLLKNVSINQNEVVAEAGIKLAFLAKLCINASLSGFEYISCIPGTLGGALYGNAGVKDHTIYDYLKSVDVIREGKIVNIKKEEIDINYRHTSFKNSKDIIVRATFALESGDISAMEEIVKDNSTKRLKSQPLEYRNAGSVFKNPEGDYAGRLIEAVGLKGYSIGDASVSMKHANFIINKGNATSKDITDLIKLIQEKVYKEFNIMLELEQIIVEW